MPITRTNAYTATETVLIQLTADVWNDYLLDYEDEINEIALKHFHNTGDEEGKIFLFEINDSEITEMQVRIILAEREGDATDIVNDELALHGQYIMDCFEVKFDIRNHVKNETWV